jgi:exopolysaccharide biosynthesis polyprenyl glycosylphosphotransferase
LLKTHWRIVSILERFADNVLIVACFFGTYYLRDPLLSAANSYAVPFPQELKSLGVIEDYLIVLGIALPLYNAFISLLGGYRSMRFSSWFSLLRMSVLASGLVFLCEGSFLYLLKIDLSRSFVGIFCISSGVVLFLERISVLGFLRFLRLRGRNYRNLLVVGTGAQARKIYLEVLKQPELGVRVVGFVDVSSKGVSSKGGGTSSNEQDNSCDGLSAVYDLPARVIADTDGFESALKKFAVDEVLFTDVIASFSIIHELAQIATEEGVQVTIAADLFSLEIFQSDTSYFGTIPFIHFHPSPGGSDSPALLVKRLIDVTVSSVLVVLLSPLMLIVAFGIRLQSPGPVFFRQKRVGKNGRLFILLKFRSMVQDAERKLDSLRDKNEMSGPVFKIKNDPRVTPFGRFLRRYSIDELPQLFNVLKGDMSLVGPRPPLPEEVSMYMRKQRKRLSMRPGLTCTWQVSGRNEIPDFEYWANLDLEYINTWSLWKDFKLLLRTIPAVLSGSGAS